LSEIAASFGSFCPAKLLGVLARQKFYQRCHVCLTCTYGTLRGKVLCGLVV